MALLLLGSWSSTLPSQHRAVSSPRSPPCYLPKSLLGKPGLHHSPASHILCSLPLPSAGPGLVCARGRLSPNLNPSVRVRVPQFGLGRGRGRPGGPGGPGAGPGAEAGGRARPIARSRLTPAGTSGRDGAAALRYVGGPGSTLEGDPRAGLCPECWVTQIQGFSLPLVIFF